jgi:type II secretory pathway pseudopilin PulG
MGLSLEVMLVIGCIASLATLAVLYAMASSIRNAVNTHDLRVRAITLRNERIAYLREQHSEETVVTEISLPGVNAASPGQEPAMIPATSKSAAPAKKKH